MPRLFLKRFCDDSFGLPSVFAAKNSGVWVLEITKNHTGYIIACFFYFFIKKKVRKTEKIVRITEN
jgi:hypothetical protein